jgi:HTH-type transcriptional regulator/antitoxin HipB
MTLRESAVPSIKTPVELGAVIRDARERHGWTQADLARRANVTRQWVIRLEKGRHDKAEIGLVLAVLNVSGVPLYAGGPPEQGQRLVTHIHGEAIDLDTVINKGLGS